jgi:trans-2,3-dihydro-3-hydroxyanthranilate isomerase
MRRRYATADVFTDRMFGGNPVAVVLDAIGLSTGQMQAIALEFNYTETTFVLPPRDPAHTAQVRIFTPDREIPFAGHPNIGTAFLLARQMAARGETVPDRFVFEERAGLVPVKLLQAQGIVSGAELTAPEPLSRRTVVPVDQAAACLGLAADDLRIDAHAPQVLSVGLPFLVVELATRDALRRAKPVRAAYENVFPLDDAKSIYAYTRDTGTDAPVSDPTADDCDLQARMFTGRMTEDPATGSATAAASALLAALRGQPETHLRIRQGVDMGRPSLLLAGTRRRDGTTVTFVGGGCVEMFEGSFVLASAGGDA